MTHPTDNMPMPKPIKHYTMLKSDGVVVNLGYSDSQLKEERRKAYDLAKAESEAFLRQALEALEAHADFGIRAGKAIAALHKRLGKV